MLIDFIDEKVQQDLNQILERKLEDYDRSFSEKLFGYDPKNNMKEIDVKVTLEKSDTTRYVLNIVKPFFDKAGLEVNTNDGLVTYYSYCYDTPKYIDTSYDVSTMNSAYSPDSNVNFCIIVTKKDENLKYGDMEIYEEYPSFLSIFGYEKEKKTKVSLKSGSVLVVDGSTLHKLQGCSGSGYFNFIQVILCNNNEFDF